MTFETGSCPAFPGFQFFIEMIYTERIFQIKNEKEFEELALEIFYFQSETVPVYKEFINYLKLKPKRIDTISKIPFLPVEFFKSHKIIVQGKKPQIVFDSSGTTGSTQSRHFVADVGLYKTSFLKSFSHFYGDPSEYCILALLPSYLERSGSSLVYMAEELIKYSGHPMSGFYLDETDKLMGVLRELKSAQTHAILIGVSFALADLAETYQGNLSGIIFMETGGMKGRRKEMVREELHGLLKNSFRISEVHSEYGMTELLSQAYSKGNGIFNCPLWMKILLRDSYDPLQNINTGNTGTINIIDLANIYSCSFLATSDLGKLHPDGSFEVLGRMDNSDIRGCNLMVG
jgi:phenylacetate-coenzyme A ligase PaaK-like adenylate-forming protein